MRLCVIGTAINPVPTNTAWSGIESLVTYLVKGLVELGQDVTLVSVEGSLWKDWNRIDLIEVPVKGPDVEQSFYEGYKGKIGGFDVVHDHSNGKLARHANPHTLGTFHWLQHPAAMDYRNGVCISNAHARWTRAQYPLGLNRAPVVVYNGADPSMFPFQEEKGDEFLFFSVMGPYKGADTVLELAKAHPEYRFAFGGRNTTYTDVVRSASRVLPNVTLYGEVDHETKKRLMGRARALLQLPKPYNRREQFPFMDIFPMTLVESNLCGTPVIGLAIDGVAEMIETGRNGVLCGSLEEVVEALSALGTYHLMTPQSCREYAETRFSHLKMARSYIELYQKVTAGGSW